MEKKTFKFELKELKEDGQFEGYASVFNVKDAVNDVVEPGAFKKTLTEKREFPLLWYHDPRDVLGIVEAEEDGKGLKIIGKLNMGVQKAREKYELLKQKAIKGLSIGYDTIKEAWENELRKLKEIKLWEVSLCTFQANPEAVVTGVKAVVPFQDLPLADIERGWDASEAVGRVRNWAGGPEKDNVNWSKYRKAFLWYDAEDLENFGSYKLPIADVIDGQLKAVPRGIFAAAAAIQGARGGVNIPQSDIQKIKSHLARYYKKLDRTPPWESTSISLDEFLCNVIDVVNEVSNYDNSTSTDWNNGYNRAMIYYPNGYFEYERREEKVGRIISSANIKLIKQAINALTALLEAAEPQKSTQKSDGKPQSEDNKPEDRLLSEMIEELKKLRNLMEVKKHGK